MKKIRNFVLAVLAVLLVAGHIIYWYVPRPREGAPEAGSLPARLLDSGAYDACLWVPYPHQNVGALSGRIGDGAAWLAAVAGIADLPAPVLPSFGPFAVPPSHEIAACSDLSGDRFFLVANVYPSVAAVARLAGKLANNPWLAGGEVREVEEGSKQVDERVLRVAWRGSLWTVSSGDAPDFAAEPPPASQIPPGAAPRTLGMFRLDRDVSELPTGDYLLRRRDGDLEVTLERKGAGAAPGLPAGDAPVLLAVAGPSWPSSETRPLPPAAFALFDIGEVGDGGALGGRAALSSLGTLPGMAVFHPPGARRWEVPTQGLAGLLTGGLPRGNAAGWSIVAVDDQSLARAQALAPRLVSLAPPDGGTPVNGRLVLGLWLQPAPALRLVTRVRKFFQKVPLVAPGQVQRWKDWETLLKPLAPCERVALAATQSPPSFRLRLYSCR